MQLLNDLPMQNNADVLCELSLIHKFPYLLISVRDRRVSYRQVGDSWFDSRTGNASLCSEKDILFFLIGQAVYTLWWPKLMKQLRTEPEKRLALTWLNHSLYLVD